MIAPYALRAQVEDILRPVPERSAVHSLVNTGIIGVFQIVVDAQQFLSAGNHGVGQQTGLVPPDDSLGPGVHGPGVVAVPHVVHAEGFGLRACLKSSNEDGNEGKNENLSRNKEFALTIFPKSAEFVEPAEKTLYHPAARQHNKLV